jgi:hypothetical protein
MTNSGYVGMRRGLVDHVIDGRLTMREHSAYAMMIKMADRKTGIWIGSAKHLSSLYGAGDVDERLARYLLESLERKGYIKRFLRPRQRGNYPILVDKFECSDGAHKGLRLNAAATADWRDPVYDPLPSDCSPARPPSDAPTLSKQKGKRKTNTDQALPEPEGFAEFWEAYPRKENPKRALSAWTRVRVSDRPAVMAGLEIWTRSQQWARGVIPHPSTWLNDERWKEKPVEFQQQADSREMVKLEVPG